MKNLYLEYAKAYIAGKITASAFSEAYIRLHQIDMNSDPIYDLNNPAESECKFSIFIAADRYYPESLRDDGDLDEEQLRDELIEIFKRVGLPYADD